MKIDKGITSFYLKNGINFLRRQKLKIIITEMEFVMRVKQI